MPPLALFSIIRPIPTISVRLSLLARNLTARDLKFRSQICYGQIYHGDVSHKRTPAHYTSRNQYSMNEPRKTGFSMYVLAAVLLIGLLTALFTGILNNQGNGNKSLAHERTILQRSSGGHYLARGRVNNEKVVFLVDTGATTVAVPQELASELSLIPGQEVTALTANGMSNAYTTIISSLQLGNIIEYDVEAVLVPNFPGGQILLGMSFLERLDFSQRGDTLILEAH